MIIFADQTTKTITYITSPEGLTAIAITSNPGSQEWYWVFTDHLGSITTLLRERDGQKFEMSFDAWGNRRNADTWENYTTSFPDFIIDRGFTGHEHLGVFGLINMNGRVYDPVVARFLSPDPYIQAPGMPQNYNGYVYCLNNPLVYTDPDGEFFIPAMMIFAFSNIVLQGWSGNAQTPGDFALAAGIGAAGGAAGAGIGAGVGSVMMGGNFIAGATGACMVDGLGFFGGAIMGGAGAGISGFINGAGNSWAGGSTFGEGLMDGLNAAGTSALYGAAFGGVFTGIDAAIDGRNFFTGKNPYYEVTLEGFSLTYQDNSMNCKNATLESIEKMNGGTRTQSDLKILGDAFLKENPNASLEEYFEFFGYNVENPAGKSHRFIGNLMKTGNPTVIDQNIGGGHTITITKIRQWTPKSNVKVWFGDPARGTWKANWNIIGSSSFNRGAYSFVLAY